MEEIINFQGNCLYKTNINYYLSQEEKSHISKLQYKTKNHIHFISKNVKILDNSLFNNLSKIFNKYALYYIKNILEIDHELKRLNSWVTINKKGGFHTPHKHTNTFISICFYPQVIDGGIRFTNPPPLISKTNLSFNNIKSNGFNSNDLEINLTSGTFIIFPGWLEHSGTVNNSDTDRIMIGSNYFISGNLGNIQDVNELKLL